MHFQCISCYTCTFRAVSVPFPGSADVLGLKCGFQISLVQMTEVSCYRCQPGSRASRAGLLGYERTAAAAASPPYLTHPSPALRLPQRQRRRAKARRHPADQQHRPAAAVQPPAGLPAAAAAPDKRCYGSHRWPAATVTAAG
jgi:hypothetical protein